MRNFIKIVDEGRLTENKKLDNRADEGKFIALMEARADADAMIASILNNMSPDLKDLEEQRRNLKSMWEGIYRVAVRVLKKQDRVIWCMKAYRAFMVLDYSRVFRNVNFFRPEYVAKIKADYIKRTGVAFETEDFDRHSLAELEHFYSLPIPAIQNYQLRNQSYRSVIDKFTMMETQWKETNAASFEDDGSGEILIDCGNDWFWVNTNTAYCSKEALAMGHCGNQPRSGSSDRILSLRRRVKIGKEVHWQPHLTFILDGGGKLTEMKGRGNDKPAAKYHSMIIQLLRNPIVKGIKGGGYMPGNNFAMDDLPKDVEDQLIAEKPELASPTYLLRKAIETGVFDDTTVAEINTGLDEVVSEPPVWSEDRQFVRVLSWDDVPEFIDDCGDETIKTYADDDHHFEADYEMEPDSFFSNLPTPVQQALGKIAKDLWLENQDTEDEYFDEDEFDEDDDNAVIEMLKDEHSPEYAALQQAVWRGSESGMASEAYNAMISGLKNFKPEIGAIRYKETERDGKKHIQWDGMVELWVKAVDAAKVAVSLIEEDGEYDTYETHAPWMDKSKYNNDRLTMSVPYYGFSDFDDEAAMEAFWEHTELDRDDYKMPDDLNPDNMSEDDLKEVFDEHVAKLPTYQASQFQDNPRMGRVIDDADRRRLFPSLMKKFYI